MAYTGSRKPSVLGTLGSWLVSGGEAVVLWWVVVVTVRHAPSVGGFAGLAAAFLGWLIAAIVLHECGHLAMGLALGEPVRKIRIGAGPTIVGFRVRSLTVQVCLNPISGGAVYFSRIGVARGSHIASLIAGPAVNLIAFIYGFVIFQSGADWLGPLVLANFLVFLGSATPATSTVGDRHVDSDGMQLLKLLFRPAVPRTNYEGAEMTDDAHAVLARAGEDASLAGEDEVTDMDLLRALQRDAAVGALFASAGLTDRIPPVGVAETDDVTQPKVSKVLDAAIVAALRRCRDMAIYKPSAASFCLGLVVTECPAGRLMKDAGITEEAVLKLITSRPEQDDDLRRTRVITPDLPLERWGTAADATLAQAFRIAVADHSPYVGTEHLIAAVVAAPASRGALCLARLGFVLTWKKEESGAGDTPDDGVPILSPQLSLALAGAIWRTGPTRPTGTAELLLGIVDQSAGIGAQILLSAGVGPGELEKALRLTPRETSEPCGCTETSRGLWMLRASARVGAERWLDSRADFLAAERAATTDAQRALCSNNIAWVSLMTGDPVVAADALERTRVALAFKPDQIAFIGTRAFALLESGSTAEAAALLEEVIPKHGRPRNRASDLCLLAICRARLGQPDVAAQRIAEAAAADPRCPLLVRARADLETASTAVALSSTHGR